MMHLRRPPRDFISTWHLVAVGIHFCDVLMHPSPQLHPTVPSKFFSIFIIWHLQPITLETWFSITTIPGREESELLSPCERMSESSEAMEVSEPRNPCPCQSDPKTSAQESSLKLVVSSSSSSESESVVTLWLLGVDLDERELNDRCLVDGTFSRWYNLLSLEIRQRFRCS